MGKEIDKNHIQAPDLAGTSIQAQASQPLPLIQDVLSH